MGKWSVIVPEAVDVTNLVTNPSIEKAPTGYTAVGGSVAQSSAQSRRGAYSLAVSPSATTTDGVYYGTVALSLGTSYTFSLDVFGVNAIPYRIYFGTTGGAVKGTPKTFTGTGAWQRVSVTWTADADASFRLYVVKNGSSNTGGFYIDGMICVALDHDHTYIDGEQEGCEWSGTEHASTSIKRSGSRLGGREYFLEDAYFYIEEMSGAGMPPLANYLQDNWQMDGASYLGGKAGPRTLLLSGTVTGTSLANLHSNRKTILGYLRPDLVAPRQPFKLRYSGASSNTILEIEAVLDAEAGKIDQITYQKTALRLLAPDPFFYEEGNDAQVMTIETSLSAYYSLFMLHPNKANGTWSSFGSSMNAIIYAQARAASGTLYFGGDFTNVGDANGDKIVSLSPSGTLASLGTGMSGGSVLVLKVAANGDLYAGGSFTLAGGVANTVRIAMWTTGGWAAFGTGIASGSVYALEIGNDGSLYVGGNFTNHGDANGDGIVKWNGAAWSSLSTGISGGTGTVYDIKVAPNGDIYIAGEFTTAGGVACANIARWNGSAFTALGSGTNGIVRALAFGKDGTLYAGGEFTTAGGSPANYVAKWNGSAWSALGSGVNNSVNSLGLDENGLLYVGGSFTSAGGIALATRAAIWTGSSWAHLPAVFPGSPYVSDILCAGDDIYFAFSTSGTLSHLYVNTVTNNGSAHAYPVFRVTRSGGTSATLSYLKNEETGATIWLNYALQDEETLTIDFRPGHRSISSSHFGPVWRALLRNSDFADFYLLPGTNHISAFAATAGSPGFTSNLQWRAAHWSLDGAAA